MPGIVHAKTKDQKLKSVWLVQCGVWDPYLSVHLMKACSTPEAAIKYQKELTMENKGFGGRVYFIDEQPVED